MLQNTAKLSDLGPRIAIIGYTSSGKSSLAHDIGHARGLPAFHIDLMHHQPGTQWQPRPRDEYLRLHAKAIAQDKWVIDGSYTSTMPERLDRATSIIWLNMSAWTSLSRYLYREYFVPVRPGNLPGARPRVSWEMVHLILFGRRQRIARMRAIVRESGKPWLEVRSMRELDALREKWGLPQHANRRAV